MQAAVNYDMAQLQGMIAKAQGGDGLLARLKSTGGLSDPELGRNTLRELFQRGSTGDNDARAFADIFSNLTEKQRQRFNYYGGDIRKLDTWNAPQKHDASLLLQGGRSLSRGFGRRSPDDAMDQWVEFITPLIRPFDDNGVRLDADATRELLESSYKAITTNGASRREPDSVLNASKLANRHQESRAFHFLDADAWLKYADEYGGENPLDSMVQHTIGMARDTAVLKTLGPSPQAVHNVLRANAQAADANQPLKMNRGTANLDNVWMNVTGLGRDGNDLLASSAATVRGVASSAKLGGAVVSALSDPAIGMTNVLFNGTGVGRYAMNIVKQLTPGLSRAGTARAKALGYIQDVVVDEFMNVQRFSDPEITGVLQRLNTRLYKASLLTPWDRAQRTAYKLAFVDGASRNLKNPNTRMAYTFKRAGITEGDRAKLMDARNRAHGGLIDMKKLDFELAIKWAGLVETEIAGGVVTPTARTHALLNQGQQVGTVAGESMRMMTQWKSHPIAFSQTQIARMANLMIGRHTDLGVPMRFWYPMVGTMSLAAMGGIAVQAKEISKGRTPLEVDWKLAGMGMVQGGAGGLWYEAAFGALMNGRSPFQLLSPAALTMFDDVLGTGIFGNIDDTGMSSLDEQLVEYLGGATVRALGWVPGQSLWYLRSTYEQVVMRMAAENLSEDELRKMDARIARRESATGQEQFKSIGGLFE